MRHFLAMLPKVPCRPGTNIAVATSLAVALTAVTVVFGLMGRVERLESDLRMARTRLAELTMSQSRLSDDIHTADRSIKSLQFDLDNPRVRPLASVDNIEMHLHQ